MIELKLKYQKSNDIDIKWMMDIEKVHDKPDSVEVTTVGELLNTELQWLSTALDWIYDDNDNRDIKVNGEFYTIDDFTLDKA